MKILANTTTAGAVQDLSQYRSRLQQMPEREFQDVCKYFESWFGEAVHGAGRAGRVDCIMNMTPVREPGGLLDFLEEVTSVTASAMTKALNRIVAGWWDDLSPEARKAYIKEHPNSKYAGGGKGSTPAPKTRHAQLTKKGAGTKKQQSDKRKAAESDHAKIQKHLENNAKKAGKEVSDLMRKLKKEYADDIKKTKGMDELFDNAHESDYAAREVIKFIGQNPDGKKVKDAVKQHRKLANALVKHENNAPKKTAQPAKDVSNYKLGDRKKYMDEHRKRGTKVNRALAEKHDHKALSLHKQILKTTKNSDDRALLEEYHERGAGRMKNKERRRLQEIFKAAGDTGKKYLYHNEMYDRHDYLANEDD